MLLVRWDLASDTFEAGQWLQGRVYERRCDLSPTGDRLVYFAANYRRPFQTWTAISRPPYFTALALWPKGNAWGGGGLFSDDEHTILLNHDPSALALAPGFTLPSDLHVAPSGNAGMGEDDPIFSERLVRDGWMLVHEGAWQERSSNTSPMWWTCEPPETWRRRHPRSGASALQMRTLGLHERNGPWYVTSYEVVDADGRVKRDLGRADWADWQPSGDLLFARDGGIFRLAMDPRGRFDPHAQPREIIDLSSLRFEARESVPEALLWDGPRPRGINLLR